MTAPSEMTPLRMSGRRICATCEYFDGGGLRSDGEWRDYHGDCLNTWSPVFETTADDVCGQWFEDITIADDAIARHTEPR